MPDDRQRERDLILSPNEFAFISDQTKGNINVYVGPYKASLSTTDQPISFNPKSKRFEKCSLERSIEPFAIAPESWYLTLKNPAKDDQTPQKGTVNNMAELKIGHKVNIPGPIAFPMWPGQMAKVVKGHHLRSNQYLVVRVYDEIAARENWENAVMKSQGEGADATFDVEKLSLGQQLIIKGTDVSFYIPPTGIEVVKDNRGEYIRKAVTLERLEYCILLDENGNKRYVRGPEVVFPEPTESFIEQEGKRKFRAIELSEVKGIYIKVIAPYEEGETGTDSFRQYKEGDELFLTGNDMMIYFPRREHAIIKYGENEIHHAVAIPAGEARYVMNRVTGAVNLRKGPDMLLPDPRKEVIIRRVLSHKQVKLLFPGNVKAQEVNELLRKELSKKKQKSDPRRRSDTSPLVETEVDAVLMAADEETSEVFSGDSFQRKQTYTPPRTITLDTKYEGAVSIDIWTGYAIMVVSKSGERKVIVGPKTHLLEYDEDIQVFSLSCGNPKSDERLIQDVYLRVLNNKVSDTLSLETKDFVPIQISLSYRLNFIDDANTWFNVENYVKFLTDRFRSILRAQIKEFTINEFYTDAFKLIRKIILGEGEKPGYHFRENNMFVYDVEVVEVSIGDENISDLLTDAQQSLIEESATKTRETARLAITRFMEEIKQKTAEAQYNTKNLLYDYQKEELEKKTLLEISKLESENKATDLRLNQQIAEEKLVSTVKDIILGREKKENEQQLLFDKKRQELYEKELEAQVRAVVDKAKAISPDLISALQAFGDKELLQKMAESMAPLSILGGESVAEVFAKLLKGTKLEGVFLNVGSDTISKIIPSRDKKE